MNLEQLLLEMSKYGRPNLLQMDTGTWYCSVKLNIEMVGCDMTIKSNFNHPTPIDAAQLCFDRLRDALNNIQKNVLPFTGDSLTIGVGS